MSKSKDFNRDISSADRSASSNANSLKYNRYVGGDKVLPVDGYLERFSGIAAVADVSLQAYSAGMEPGVLLALYNTTGTTQYIGFQEDGGVDFGVVTPDSTNAIALRPNDYTTIVIPWETTGLRASAAGIIPYCIRDDSKFVKRS